MTQLVLIFLDNLILPEYIHWLGTTLITAIIALLRQSTANLLFHYFKKRTVRLITLEQARTLERLQKCIIV